MGKPHMEFVDGTAMAQGPHSGFATNMAVSADGMPLTHEHNEPLPSYASILSSDATVLYKAQSVYAVSRLHVTRSFASLRPWSEFFDMTFFGVPAGVTDVVNRLNRNLPYFYANYLILSLVCSSYILLINLAFSIYVMIMVLWYLYIRSQAAEIAEAEDPASATATYRLSPSQGYLALGVVGLIGFYYTSGSSVVFWLLLTSLGVSCGHAAMRRPPLADSAFEFA